MSLKAEVAVDSSIRELVLKHKEVAVALTPPLTGLGFLSTSLAPKGIEPRHGFTILISYGLRY